ncbi:uncharacterized protein [Clytia hemisphaerica]
MTNISPNEKTPMLDKSSALKLQNLDSDGKKDDGLFPNNPFSEKFDKQFWNDVSAHHKENPSKPWMTALNEERLKKIRERCEDEGIEEILIYFMDLYDRFHDIAKAKNELGMMHGFVGQLSSFVHLVIDQDHKKPRKKNKKPNYARTIDITEEIDMTVMHMAAYRNLTSIIQIVLQYYPKLVYEKCLCGNVKAQMPVELALEECHDDAASLLMLNMRPESVRHLFHYDSVSKENFSFSTFVSNPKMKQTVHKILDSTINPEYPYIPKDPDQKDEDNEPWSHLPNVKPQRYHCHYKILDGDCYGRSGNEEGFDYSSHSGLYDVAHSPFSDEIIEHPAVRLLTQRKWRLYGRRLVGLYIGFYLFFIVSMTCAFFLKGESGDRSIYKTTKDKIRGVFEVITFIIACIYFIIEIVELIKEKMNYLTFTNLADFIGISLVISLLPIKFGTVHLLSKKNPSELECYVAAATYFINVLRIFKYFPVIRYVGVHAKLISRLLRRDIPQFLIVYIVVAAAFLGSVILALTATKEGFDNADISTWGALLSEVRALTETNGFADDYIGKFKIGVIILLQFNMLACILILANVLIAHLSNVYTDQHARAKVQCDVDRAVLITKVENSWFKSMSARLKFYADGDYYSNYNEIAECIAQWKSDHPCKDDVKESSTEKLDKIIGLVKNMKDE